MDLECELANLDALYFSSPDDATSDDEDISSPFPVNDTNQNLTYATLENVPATSSSDKYLDCSIYDTEEAEKMNEMYGTDSGSCCIAKCNSHIPLELAREYRQNFMEFSHAEQDLHLLSQLEAHKEHSSMTAAYEETYTPRYGKRLAKQKSRFNVSYYFRGLQICKAMYFFIHPIGKTRYENVQKHFNVFGIAPRTHALLGKQAIRSVNSFSDELKHRVVTFIQSFAEKYAIPLPGRMPGFKNFDVLKLPTEMNKTFVHNEYIKKCCSHNEELRVGNRSFRNLWNTYCPYITTMKPATDLCEQCRENTSILSRAANVDTDEKLEKYQKAMAHLTKAREQREFYQNWCKKNGKVLRILFCIHIPQMIQPPDQIHCNI